jgi:hypothetical protein
MALKIIGGSMVRLKTIRRSPSMRCTTVQFIWPTLGLD